MSRSNLSWITAGHVRGRGLLSLAGLQTAIYSRQAVHIHGSQHTCSLYGPLWSLPSPTRSPSWSSRMPMPPPHRRLDIDRRDGAALVEGTVAPRTSLTIVSILLSNAPIRFINAVSIGFKSLAFPSLLSEEGVGCCCCSPPRALESNLTPLPLLLRFDVDAPPSLHQGSPALRSSAFPSARAPAECARRLLPLTPSPVRQHPPPSQRPGRSCRAARGALPSCGSAIFPSLLSLVWRRACSWVVLLKGGAGRTWEVGRSW